MVGKSSMAQQHAHISSPVGAVRNALDREASRREDGLKPIEIVKIALSASLQQRHERNAVQRKHDAAVISDDRAGLSRGTHAALDRLLFNANYWRAAYEDRIVAACTHPESARICLRAISVWTTHTLKLNTLAPEETTATFERFCPPFAINNRRGAQKKGRSKGPLPAFKDAIHELEQNDLEPPTALQALAALESTMRLEVEAYEALSTKGALDALFDILPAWCLQGKIELVNGPWWDDCDILSVIAEHMHERFLELGHSEAACRYFLDSCYEAIDAYQYDISSEDNHLSEASISALLEIIANARASHPTFEVDGYGADLPAWLISKEQLIWNFLVCALYGPAYARPLLADAPELINASGAPVKSDVMTELARTSFSRYAADRAACDTPPAYATFAHMPTDLRDSSIAFIASLHDKLAVLRYEIAPAGSSYPERCVSELSESEIECLAILEHRRWIAEREKAGWSYGPNKDTAQKLSPYLVPWEDLPEHAREWNRSAVRSIPALLASANLAVVR
ncbi:RyR domain-containing protein [Adlercreutzia murintestinalis]|uniref:RyR domain-containing protein n=1 Tax=Adlercreutzia murintestinalis TaxID=2941325 RepID=UPI00203AD795|nr:RyR domain-containing protein [Adlercreutzia murintestinalis]